MEDDGRPALLDEMSWPIGGLTALVRHTEPATRFATIGGPLRRAFEGGDRAMTPVRWLAWTVGVLFLIGTALQLVDTLNLYVTPPDAGASSMVAQRLASQDYRVAIWPIFALNNLSFGIAFVAISGLGFALAALLATGDTRRITLVTTLGIGGILGAVGQLILLGATQVTIDIAYCDCGFKETEIVAQIWAQMLANGASRGTGRRRLDPRGDRHLRHRLDVPSRHAWRLGDLVVGDRHGPDRRVRRPVPEPRERGPRVDPVRRHLGCARAGLGVLARLVLPTWPRREESLAA